MNSLILSQPEIIALKERRKTMFRVLLKPQPSRPIQSRIDEWFDCRANENKTIILPYKIGEPIEVEGADIVIIPTSVKVERLNEISEEDARAEGVLPDEMPSIPEDRKKDLPRRYAFPFLKAWDERHKRKGYFSTDKNDWVWAYTFEVRG